MTAENPASDDPPMGRHDKLPIKMLQDRIMVQLEGPDGERRSTGGILIPATAQLGKRLSWAEVKAAGPAKPLGVTVLACLAITWLNPHVYLDTVVFTYHQLAYLLEVFGPDRILMGTDYPFDMAEFNPIGHIAGVNGMDEDTLAQLAGGNAIRLLDLDL